MPGASYAVPNFLGGEISGFALGRFDRPDYKASLRVCRNSFPVEIGAWTRRPGTAFAGTTLGGNPGRVMRFDFAQSFPVTMEFTDGNLQFRSGIDLIMTTFGGDTPIQLATPYVGGTWASIRGVQAEQTQILLNAGVAPQALVVTTLPAADISPAFELNPATFLDGPYLDPFTNGVQVTPSALSGVISLTLAFPAWKPTGAYTTGDFVTSGGVNYESLVDQNEGDPIAVSFTGSSASISATNTFSAGNPVEFFVSGGALPAALEPGTVYYVIATGLSGSAFEVSATAGGSAITMATAGTGTKTVALVPAGQPGAWTPISAAAAINNGDGFLGTDVGRLVRLFSEPPLWSPASTYAESTAATPVTVSYNPTGVPGASTYWQSQTSGNTNNAPGSDLTNWQIIASGAAIWTWGKIVSLSNIIDRALAGSTEIGDMTANGGLSAAFNGVFAQASAASATKTLNGSGHAGLLASYCGKNYSGASPQQIQQATVYPTSDQGFVKVSNLTGHPTITMNLRASQTLPASSSDGTLLGTTGGISDSATAVTIVSTDQATAWNYVWVEMILTASTPISWTFGNYFAQMSFFNPPGTGTSSGINVEILGPSLLYTSPILTWRLGLYSATTSYPTCGYYNDGRLWLGGAVDNRIDACYSDGIDGGTLNFAPTDQFGAVAAEHAISYTFNSSGSNPLFWIRPDLQGIKVGTQKGEWLIQAPTAGAISPLNITARQVTSHGSSFIEPVDCEHTLVFVQRFARKLLEYFPDVFSGKFSAPNLADKAAHLTRNGVAELAYTSAVNPIIWGRDTAGNLFGITYKRDSLASSQPPTFYGWHSHALGSGRIVESICAGPSVGGNLDALTMVTNDPVTNIRHVEILTDPGDEETPLSEAWFLDDAIVPTAAFGPISVTLSGLSYLNGKTVQVFCGGADCGDIGDEVYPAYNATTTYAQGDIASITRRNFVSLQNNNTNNPVTSAAFWQPLTYLDFTVANGQITVPYGDGISAGPGRGQFTQSLATNNQIVVGFTYNSDGQLVPPMEPAATGARNGPAFAKLGRMHRYGLRLVNTLGLSVGGVFGKLIPFNSKLNGNGAALPALTMFTGVSADALPDDYAYDNSLCWRVSRPFPATISTAGSFLETQDQ